MSSRRKFIKKIAAVGATAPFISNIKAKENSNKGPIIICSRGNEWGEKVLKPGWDILSNNGDLLDAIEKSANITELDPSDTSVGYGGLPNEDGVVQLDASIMYGPTHNCGSVGALEGIKTPCSVARLVMERTDHIHIMGKGAQDFARAHGFKIENLLTEKSRKIWLRWKENISEDIIKLIKARDKSLNPSIYNLSDALFSASFLNSCLRHSEYITMANIAPLVNQTGPLYVHPKGIVKRSHFHTIAMYANELEEYVSNAEIKGSKLSDGKDSVSVIDAIATVDKKGENWAISLVNRHPSDNLECKVTMGNKLLNGTYKAKILTGESTDSYNDIEHPNRVAPKEVELKFKNGVVHLPPHSLTIVYIKGEV